MIKDLLSLILAKFSKFHYYNNLMDEAYITLIN